MLEREIEAYLKKKVKSLGGEIRKLKYQGRRGAPDRLIMLQARHFVAELKRPDGKPDPHQKREMIIMEWAGFDAYLLDTKEKIDEVLS